MLCSCHTPLSYRETAVKLARDQVKENGVDMHVTGGTVYQFREDDPTRQVHRSCL